MPRLSDFYTTAFVTGASAGLGRAFAGMLLDEGVRVWGTARDRARVGFADRGLTPVALDLADSDGAAMAFRKASDDAGGFDLVIQNAGFGLFGEFARTPFPVWRDQLQTMLLTTARLSHDALAGFAARPGRAKRPGCLVHISSLVVEFPLPYMSGYNMAKAGLSALSESLAFETQGTGVAVIDFRPGDYRTGFNAAMRQGVDGVDVVDGVDGMDSRTKAAWLALEAHLQAAPGAERAARDLRRALLRGRSGVVRSGSFFQAWVAPFLARLSPQSLRRAVHWRYYT